MSDIFLSYASEDVAQAGELAHALMRCGWSVWWDRSILPGKVFDTVIEAELTAAKCVIVLWSQRSVASRWVRAEAGEALDKGRLIPALIDDAVIPLVFRQVQAASLAGWGGDTAHPGFQQLVKAVGAAVPATPAVTAATPAAHSAAGGRDDKPHIDSPVSANDTRPDQHAGWWAFGALSVLVIAVGAYNFLRDDASTGVSPVADEQQPELSPGQIAATPAPQPPQAKDESGRSGQAEEDKAGQPAPDQKAAAAKAAKPAALTPAPDQPKHANPVVKQPAPVAAKPAYAAPAVKPAPAPDVVAKAETAETAVKPAGPLTALTVVWAMPSDDGVASTARVKEYSTALSHMMTALVDESISAPVHFEYYYPNQQEYYRLLKDGNAYATSKILCGKWKADLVISGFVKGAKFVSASYGYALTREPVFSVFDCKTYDKITRTYEIAEKPGDRFPFEQSTANVFRNFVQQEAALAKR